MGVTLGLRDPGIGGDYVTTLEEDLFVLMVVPWHVRIGLLPVLLRSGSLQGRL